MEEKIIIDVTSDAEKAAGYFRKGHKIRIYPYGGFARVTLAESLEEVRTKSGTALFVIMKELRGDENR